MKPATKLSVEDRAAARRFIESLQWHGPPPINAVGVHGISREQYFESYPSWSHGGRSAWYRLGEGGTGIMTAICWYQHIHRPGSKEWRPSIIIRAVVAAGRAMDQPAPAPVECSLQDSHPLALPPSQEPDR